MNKMQLKRGNEYIHVQSTNNLATKYVPNQQQLIWWLHSKLKDFGRKFKHWRGFIYASDSLYEFAILKQTKKSKLKNRWTIWQFIVKLLSVLDLLKIYKNTRGILLNITLRNISFIIEVCFTWTFTRNKSDSKINKKLKTIKTGKWCLHNRRWYFLYITERELIIQLIRRNLTNILRKSKSILKLCARVYFKIKKSLKLWANEPNNV